MTWALAPTSNDLAFARREGEAPLRSPAPPPPPSSGQALIPARSPRARRRAAARAARTHGSRPAVAASPHRRRDSHHHRPASMEREGRNGREQWAPDSAPCRPEKGGARLCSTRAVAGAAQGRRPLRLRRPSWGLTVAAVSRTGNGTGGRGRPLLTSPLLARLQLRRGAAAAPAFSASSEKKRGQGGAAARPCARGAAPPSGRASSAAPHGASAPPPGRAVQSQTRRALLFFCFSRCLAPLRPVAVYCLVCPAQRSP
ncbi:unnamed protein product [Urochloa humidicola]